MAFKNPFKVSPEPATASATGRDVTGLFCFGAVALFLLMILAWSSSIVASFDIFWQLQSGKYMAETGAVINADTFSLASEVGRWEHCWLHDLIYYFAHTLGGYSLMSFVKGLLVTATALLLVATARARKSSWLSILLLGPALFLQTQTFWSDRPQLWSFVACALFLFICERNRAAAGRGLYLLLPTHIAWTNLHAGAILAFPLYAANAVGDFLDALLLRRNLKDFPWLRWLLLLIGLALVSGFSPYGWIMLTDLLPTAPSHGAASGEVMLIQNWDWRAPDFNRFPQLKYAMITVFSLMVLAWRRFSFVDLLLLVGLGYMSLTLERHSPFWFFAAWALAPRYLDVLGQQLGAFVPKNILPVLKMALAAAGVFVLFWFGSQIYQVRGAFNTGLLAWQYPVGAAEFVQKNPLSENIFHDYTSGGYLMWTLFPDYKVFWDARQNSSKMFQLGVKLMRTDPGWKQILDEYTVSTIVLSALDPVSGRSSPLLHKLNKLPQWPLVYADESFFVFVRADSVDSEWLQQHRLPEQKIADTILSAALLQTGRLPVRPGAYWEMTRIYLERRETERAFDALENYLMRTPNPEPLALRYYQMLYPMQQRNRAGE
ncbi:MAG: hypothetical protein OET90_04440 [Desulfuromonadales bacterium]|nr:hypothetical protein [Desulfuromonadales bacterium]